MMMPQLSEFQEDAKQSFTNMETLKVGKQFLVQEIIVLKTLKGAAQKMMMPPPLKW